MDTAVELRAARRRAGLSQSELAARSGTSQATVSAYESGRKTPAVPTLARLLATCDASLSVGRPRLERAGRQLAEVLALAEALPYRPSPALRFPRLPDGT